jgi:hypothetical protein
LLKRRKRRVMRLLNVFVFCRSCAVANGPRAEGRALSCHPKTPFATNELKLSRRYALGQSSEQHREGG